MEQEEGSPASSGDPLSQALLAVWRQVMVEDKPEVELQGQKFPVSKTSSKRLRQVDFTVQGRQLRGVEQNPRTTSRWAQMARRGARIMQFMENRRYLANVADGKVFLY
jgi:hypothetical protein